MIMRKRTKSLNRARIALGVVLNMKKNNYYYFFFALILIDIKIKKVYNVLIHSFFLFSNLLFITTSIKDLVT